VQDYQDRLTLATAEGVDLSVILAGAGSRILARLIDFFLVWLPIIVGGTLLGTALGNFGVALFFICLFYAFFGYDVTCERLFNGRTLGKRMVGVRVLRDSGTRVDLTSSAMRSVLTLIDFWTLSPLVAIISVLVAQDNKRLGDLAASTVVVREPKAGKGKRMKIIDVSTAPAVAPAPQPPSDWRPPAAHAPAAVATRRVLDVSAVTREDLAAITGFIERRYRLDPQVRADLAGRMATALRSRVGGGIDDLSDEQLLEAVADAKTRDD
jgi:uncharacterized RDD family membrane protein YckC